MPRRSGRYSLVSASRGPLRALLASLGLILTACGSSSITLTLSPEQSNEAPDLSAIVALLQARADAYGADAEISVSGPDTISAIMSGIDEATARRLVLERAFLEFRFPRLIEGGSVVCQTPERELFAVVPDLIGPDEVSRQPAHCFTPQQRGKVFWESTFASETGQQEAITGADAVPGEWTVAEEPSGLKMQLTTEGSELLEEITSRLPGYPLGIFLDDILIGAPKIQQAITDGRPVIFGLNEAEARLRAAQLNGGTLSIALREVSAP